jgi:hypothetical protein
LAFAESSDIKLLLVVAFTMRIYHHHGRIYKPAKPIRIFVDHLQRKYPPVDPHGYHDHAWSPPSEPWLMHRSKPLIEDLAAAADVWHAQVSRRERIFAALLSAGSNLKTAFQIALVSIPQFWLIRSSALPNIRTHGF